MNKTKAAPKLWLRCLIFCLVLIFAAMPLMQVLAEPDGNMTGGGGGMGTGTDQNFWTPGKDGVRVTVVNIQK